MRVSISRVNEVDVRVGAVGGDGQGVGGTGQAGVKVVEVCPGLLVAVPLKICCTA